MKILARFLADVQPKAAKGSGRDISDCFDIQFGEGERAVTVSVRDGFVEVSSRQQVVVLPRAANTIQIRVQPLFS
jgi:hypothetical protein